MDILSKKIPIFHEILKVLDYSIEDQYKRVNDFITICQLTTVEKLLQICKNEGMDFHPNGVKDEKDFNGLVIQIAEVVGEKRVEQVIEGTVTELMDDFVATVYPECDEENKRKIDVLLNEK